MTKVLAGTSIIEIVIAAALISVAVISALSLSNHSQKQNTYARDLAEASKYTSEAADWLRTQRNDLGWATINAKIETDGSGSAYCLNTLPGSSSNTDFTDLPATGCSDSNFIADTLYQREITLDNSEQISGIIKATIVVGWTEQTDRTSTLDLELTKW